MDTNSLIITDRNKVRQHWGKTETDIQNDIQLLREWLKTQKHLPETPTDVMIEFFLTNCKFSIEKTKDNIDMYYSVRTLVPEFFTNSNPRLPEMRDTWEHGCFCPLPKLTKDLYRIIVVKYNDSDMEKFDINKLFAQFMNVCEIRLHEDSCIGFYVIVDLKDFKIAHLMKLTPMVIRKAEFVNQKVGKGRLKGIHLLNVPAYADKGILLVKSIMKKKLADRIMVHHSNETLYDCLSKELLPKNYGGDEKSLEELTDLWKAKMEEYQERFDLLDILRVDEELRPEPLKNSDVLGYYGNFKKIDVD